MLLNQNLNVSYIFLKLKNTLCCPACRKSKFSKGACSHTPWKKGTNGLLLVLSVILIKPAGYFNFC